MESRQTRFNPRELADGLRVLASNGDRKKNSKRQRVKVQTEARVYYTQKSLSRHGQRDTDVGKCKASGCNNVQGKLEGL